MLKKAHAFTVVELLIVIVVIAILAAVSIVAYNGIQNRAVATTLQSDLRNAATQLGIIKATDGNFPNPNLPGDIKKSTGTGFEYTSDGMTYCLTATSGRAGVSAYNVSSTGSISEGACPGHSATGNIALSCPGGFIPVPGNSHYGTSDFCVMKYEAKNVGGVATSQPGDQPWVNISQNAARTAAEGACSGCSLITDVQWMTIAMNITSVASNWSGGSVGNGYIYRGHSDSNPASILAASSNDASAYEGTGNSSSSGTDQRRTLTLTNGEVIWDIAGNAWEWTNDTITSGKPGLIGESSSTWKDYNNPNLQWNGLSANQPTGTLYARSQGWGALFSNPTDTSLRALIRGGNHSYGLSTGILTLSLSNIPDSTGWDRSFRAVKQ